MRIEGQIYLIVMKIVSVCLVPSELNLVIAKQVFCKHLQTKNSRNVGTRAGRYS